MGEVLIDIASILSFYCTLAISIAIFLDMYTIDLMTKIFLVILD